ncbi:MAG: hypothetical protein KGO52_05465 [Nitrospirota bacterium]|nr:hypothetical protein [Nitrospirota bacterium]
MSTNPDIAGGLGQTGQVASHAELERLVYAFEAVLKRFGIPIQSGSELEGACCSVLEVMVKNQNAHVRNPQEDIRHVFTEVLGIWSFLKKIVRLESHACFPQFVPHLALLNKGAVVQNKRATVCQEATNKIFELLFALVLLDVSEEVVLDHPDLAKGDNPDVLATIDGQCWGFACKTIYGASGKTFYDNLKKGVEQIEAAPKAQIGVVVMNLRNTISHEACWPILNEADYRKGAEPIFSAYSRPEAFVASHILDAVRQKYNQVVDEIGLSNVMNLFAGKKALPAFVAFCQTCTGKVGALGPIPMSVATLNIGAFGDVSAHQGVIDKINSALHERFQQ